jgi:hypothetical protein
MGRWHLIPCVLVTRETLTLWVSTRRHALLLSVRQAKEEP